MDSIPIPHPTGLPAHADIVIGQRDVHEEDDTVDQDDDENDEGLPNDQIAPALAPPGTENGSVELWSKQSRPRGRRARDPNAETVRFDCKDVDDLEIYLRDYLEAPTANAEHATIEFHFPVTAAFMVYTRDFKRDSSTNWTSADVTDLMRKTAVSVFEVLQETQNPKDQIVRQKAVGRTIVEAVQRADKFKYSFHNNWLSREDQAHRFSFFCNDSTLNKGRAANGGAGTEGKVSRKPVYDCKGLIAVKFSVTKQNLEVHYKHVPIHATFDERAPLPRRESKRRRMLEVLDPDRLKTLREMRKKKLDEERLAAGWIIGKNGRPQKPESEVIADALKKRRRRSEGPQTNNLDEQAIADEGLQPLLDFLGSAERTGGSDDDVVVTDRDSRPQRGHESTTPPAFPRAKLSELRNTAPRRRAKYLGALLPGMMEGSLRSGNMNWTVTTPTKPPGEKPSQDSSTKPSTEKQKQKRKSREGPEEDRGRDKRQNREDETELEQLKRRLYETEQRLMKIEAEKGMAANSSVPPQPPPPAGYPPYPYYGYYPYLSPAHPPYPPPPPTQPPPPTEQTATGGPRKSAWVVYQPPQDSTITLPQNQRQADRSRPIAAQTVARPESAANPSPLPTARTDSHRQAVAKGDGGQQQPRDETALQSKTSTGPRSTKNRTIPTPVTQPQSGTSANVPSSIPATQARPWMSSENQAPTQTPSQIPSASLGSAGPAHSSWGLHSSNPIAAQAAAGSSLPGPAPQQPSPSAGSTMAGSQKSSQQPVRGGVKLNDVRNIQPAANSGEREDPYLKGLFDNAMAAIMRIPGAAKPHNDKTTSAATTAPTEASPTDTTCGPTLKVVKEPWGTLPPSGALSFKVPNYKPPPRNFYKYGTDTDVNKTRGTGGKTSPTSSGTSGTSIAPPYPPPQYPYPYPPNQQNYPPPPPGPPPPGYPPYPPHGYPPYPPPPGYGYPPYPPYPYPPAPVPYPAETEEQRKVREQKEKDGKEGAPAWATQLREAMTGYANGTPDSAPVGRTKAKETRRESVAVSNEDRTVSNTANRNGKNVGPTNEREVVEIDSDAENDSEGSERSQGPDREREVRSTSTKSGSVSSTSAHDGEGGV